MSYDSATFSHPHHSVLSPPLLAAIDSQHTFSSYDAAATPSSYRAGSVDASAASHDPCPSTSRPPSTRTRASSSTSSHHVASANGSAPASSLHQNGHIATHKKARRAQTAHSAHSRSGSRSGPMPMPSRSVYSHSSAASNELGPLYGTSRNRSTTHLDGLRSLTAASGHNHASAATSAMTAPLSPLMSASASSALAMSPVAQASAMVDHLMPSEWTLDSSVPSTPYTNLSRNASDYFDPTLLAQLQSQNGSSHPELRSSGPPRPSPPMDTVFGRLSPHQPHAARSASQSGWAQHAAHMQQTAHLLGLQRLFASRSTPHLPDLDSSYIGHDFESPPPYAPRASVHETELDRAADVNVDAGLQHSNVSRGSLPSNSTSASTLLDASDPPLPPPISIPSSAGTHSASGPPSASALVRPSLRARSSSRGSRSGPPSPSASFYGRRGLTSLSPFPAGLEMTPSVAQVASFSSTPVSPGFAPDSDGDEDADSVLSFSSSRSKQRRDERRQTIASTDNLPHADVANGLISSSLPGSSAQALATLSRRRRSGSAGSARQLLRPRTPITSSVPRAFADQSQHAAEANHFVSTQDQTAACRLSAMGSSTSNTANVDGGASHRRPTEHAHAFMPRSDHDDGDTSSQPVSPTSDSTRPDSPQSPGAAFDLSPSTSLAGNANDASTRNGVANEEADFSANAAQGDDEEEFPLVLKLLLRSLRVLAAVPGCIGTFWLARNAWLLAIKHGHLLSPGQMMIAADGTSRFQSSGLSEQPSLSGAYRFGRRQPGSLEFVVACLWSMSTAYHALSFTTLLLRRWLLYYSILPSLIRLVALQAICWPLVRITIHVFGADQPLGAWVVIGTTTALSDVVSRWVTSNIADAPLDDELDEEEEQQEAENEALGYLSDSRFVKSPVRPNAAERLMHADQSPWSAAGGQTLVGDSDWDPRSGDESDAAAASVFASERERQRQQRRGGQGTRFWRAVIGGPSFAASSRRRKTSTRSSSAAAAAKATHGDRSRVSGAGTETEMEAESDWPGYTTDGTVLGGGRGDTPPPRFAAPWNQQGLRRRLGAIPAHVSSPASATPPSLAATRTGVLGRGPVLPPLPPSRASSYRQGHTRFVYKDGAWTRERTSSLRNFHWEVAVWRNVVPIAVLSYLSMWILIFDAMRLGG
ncbi:probable Myp1 protein [Sporisorium reilianum SRZ2]|uniref:Probable Myp1 protein n=1 Tax=Sporisorium reilianum (strain SRZ2) TaxID=999809 RepID=E6ZUI1_SPORE|nr:probable Myp1 protein [Sporisorium reilianum SRZ2]